MRHRLGDLYNPPGLTNFLGCVQADLDLTAVRSINFPPLACSETVTAMLFVDGRYFPATGAHVTFTWWPDRIVREAEWNGLRLRSTTALPRGRNAVMVLIEVENVAGGARDVAVRLALRGGVTRNTGPWLGSSPPMEYDHDVAVDAGAGRAIFVARGSGAASAQGMVPAPDRASGEALEVRAHVPAGGVWRGWYLNALGADAAEARRVYDELAPRLDDELAAVRADWNEELRAVFTPGNDRYGGFLPTLETSDEDLRRVYLMGALGTIYFKRESPFSAIGRSYDTLMPRYWQSVTFLWDYMLSGVVHAMLDPHVMRRHLEMWMTHDIHTCFGTEWLTGGPVGGWYSVNDYAMCKMMFEYVRWTGDRDWLATTVPARGGDRVVGELLEEYATNWRQFATPNGLADYGGIGNLLECVSTYIHEIAALNAANVWSMRLAASLAESRGDDVRAKALRDEAAQLAERVNGLYERGAGFFNTRHPGRGLVPVRHSYDFQTVVATMGDDLDEQQRREMARFVLDELKTPTWMRALSAQDPDAAFSVRPDHQWTGAYPAWPPQAVAGLYRLGAVDEAFAWLKGLARTANQGPYGQAHLVEDAFPTEEGAALKSSSEFPWICDWACSSNGAWVDLVVTSVFGVEAAVDGTITATPRFGPLDPDSRLRNVSYQGRLYEVTRDGIRPQEGRG